MARKDHVHIKHHAEFLNGVVGDSASVDKELVRFNSTTGKIIESPNADNSNATATLSDDMKLTLFNAVNDGSPSIQFGSSATNRIIITSEFDSSAQTLRRVNFQTDSSHVDADKGEFRFIPDGALVATIDDGGIELATGKAYDVAGTEVLSATTLGGGVVNSSLTNVGTLTALTVDDITINGNAITSAGASSVTINAKTGEAVSVEGVAFEDASVTGIVSITATSFVGALTGNAATVTISVSGADASSHILMSGATTGTEAPKTDPGLLYDASANILKVDTIDEVTSTAGVTIDGVLIKDGIHGADSVRVTNGAQTLTTSTATTMTFDTETWDYNSMHSTVSNQGRLTATRAGKYRFSAHIRYDGNDTGRRMMRIVKNGTGVYHQLTQTSTQSDATDMEINGLIDMAATDYIELVCFQDSGGDLATETTTGGSFFEMTMLLA